MQWDATKSISRYIAVNKQYKVQLVYTEACVTSSVLPVMGILHGQLWHLSASSTKWNIMILPFLGIPKPNVFIADLDVNPIKEPNKVNMIEVTSIFHNEKQHLITCMLSTSLLLWQGKKVRYS
jgi:hypothetical protein